MIRSKTLKQRLGFKYVSNLNSAAKVGVSEVELKAGERVVTRLCAGILDFLQNGMNTAQKYCFKKELGRIQRMFCDEIKVLDKNQRSLCGDVGFGVRGHGLCVT